MLTAVRLLAGMGPDMDGQSTALDEAFVAVAPGADVGTVVGMYAGMPDEVGLAIELLRSCGEAVSTRGRDRSEAHEGAITLGHDGQEQGNSLVC